MARAERRELRLRLASAAAMMPLALAAIWLGGAFFAALVLAAALGMGWEWARLTGCRGLLVALVIGAAMLPGLALALGGPEAGIGLAVVGAAAVWGVAHRAAASAPAWAAAGAAWIALPCLACLWLETGDGGGPAALTWLFVTVWASDTGAFVAGRTIGGPRLAPALSPGKTWAGAFGGLAAAAFVGWVASLAAGGSAAVLIPAGMGLGIAAQAGDLAESLAKRRFGVKDSSGLIPGHGGLLDRLDGMLAAAAFMSLATLAAGASPFAWTV